MKKILKIAILFLMFGLVGCSNKPDVVEHFENGGDLECRKCIKSSFLGLVCDEYGLFTIYNSNTTLKSYMNMQTIKINGKDEYVPADSDYYFVINDGSTISSTDCNIKGIFHKDSISASIFFKWIVIVILLLLLKYAIGVTFSKDKKYGVIIKIVAISFSILIVIGVYESYINWDVIWDSLLSWLGIGILVLLLIGSMGS